MSHIVTVVAIFRSEQEIYFVSMTAMKLMRAFAAGVHEIQKFLPQLWGMARELYHEIMGFIFFALTLFFVFGGQGLIRSYQALGDDPDAEARLILVGLFVVMFGGFGVSSFRRERRIARSRK